jgi:mucin-19
MKLNLNKKAIAIALSLALATPIISATALPTLSVFAGGFASNPAVAQGHAIPNTDAINISGNTVAVALEGTGISDAVKATTSVTITNNAGSTIVTAPALTWTGSAGAWTGFSFQLPANWQTLFHNSEQMGVKVSSTVGSSTFNATANKIVNNDTQIIVEIPTAGATTLSAKVTGGSLYSNTVAQSLNDYTYEYTVAPQVSGSAAAASAIFSASSNIVALSNATATPDASGNFTLTLPAGKSVQSLGANDAIFVRRKAKNSNAQYIFIIDSVTTTTTTTTTPAAPAVATPSTPRATSSTATIKPATPSNSIIATGSNSRKSSGGSSSGDGSGRRSSSSNYTATTPSQTPAAPSVTPASQNTAGDATKAPSPVGPSAAKNTRGKIRVPKTADAADMTGSVMMLLGSFVAMGLVASATKKKED